jgi:hypothetical protein
MAVSFPIRWGTDMTYNVDDMTAADRPRKRLLIAIAAVLLPVIVLVGSAAWFVRSYVWPPTVKIAAQATASAIAAPAGLETTGAPPPASEPTARYTSSSAEVWASVPIPGPPRSMQRNAPAPEATFSEPPNGAVPSQQQRRRSTEATVAVPLPRPRPSLVSN